MFNTLLQHYYVHRVCGQQAYGEVSFYIKQYDFNTQVIFIFSFLNRGDELVDIFDIINTINHSNYIDIHFEKWVVYN